MQPAFVPSHLQLSAFHDQENVRVCGQIQDGSRFLKKAHCQLVGLRCTKMWFLSFHQDPQKKGWVAYSKGYENTLEPQNHLITDSFQPFQRDIYLFPRAAFKKYQKLGGLKQHKFIVSWFWRLNVQKQDGNRSTLPMIPVGESFLVSFQLLVGLLDIFGTPWLAAA